MTKKPHLVKNNSFITYVCSVLTLSQYLWQTGKISKMLDFFLIILKVYLLRMSTACNKIETLNQKLPKNNCKSEPELLQKKTE